MMIKYYDVDCNVGNERRILEEAQWGGVNGQGKRQQKWHAKRWAVGLNIDLGGRFRATRQRAQVGVVEAGGIWHMSRWTGATRPEKKKGDWVHKYQCSSVSGWPIRGGCKDTEGDKKRSSLQLENVGRG